MGVTNGCGPNSYNILTDQTIKRKNLVDQEIKSSFKVESSDQEPILAIKNFDRRRRWKYRAHCGDYPLRYDQLLDNSSPNSNTQLAARAAYIHALSLASQTFEEGRERLVTVVDFLCARGISLTASLTCCHETNVR